MLEILQHCNAEYVPKCRDTSGECEDKDKILFKVAFGGDQQLNELSVLWLLLLIQTTLMKGLSGLSLNIKTFIVK